MREVWTFDSQDFRGNAGGFQGKYTHLSGITNKEFETEAQAIARMEAKVSKTRVWRSEADRERWEKTFAGMIVVTERTSREGR